MPLLHARQLSPGPAQSVQLVEQAVHLLCASPLQRVSTNDPDAHGAHGLQVVSADLAHAVLVVRPVGQDAHVWQPV